jgi:ACS family glucarate transporter-like MFS transporter
MRQRPRRDARRTLLWFTFVLSLITFIDRVAIASAAPAIREQLHIGPAQMGWVFSAFTFAYAAFEIPSGWLGDVFGPRKILTRIVLWWSAFTAATGLAWNFASLVVARLLFGVGEAGAYPNISRSFARWFPTSERGFAHGIVFMGSRVGGAFAPPLVVLLMGWAGWRTAFFVFGSFGVVWTVFWWRWFRDRPEDHPSVSAEELSAINAEPVVQQRAVAWRDLMSVNLLMLCLMYFCVIYGLYFYLTWLPTYFKEARGYTAEQAAGLSGMVLLTGGVASLAGGWLTDRLVKRYGLKVGRSVGAVALPLAGLALITAALTSQPVMAAVCFALATAMGDLSLSPSWSMCHDIGGDAAGRVSGAMNTFGNLGGALSPLVVGYALEWTGKWEAPLIAGGVVYIIGGLLTLLINPRRSIVTR